MENVIAEQKLYSITANGESKPLILRIGAPEKKMKKLGVVLGK
jgi:hypothetical protein